MSLLLILILETLFVLFLVGLVHQSRRKFGMDLTSILVTLLILSVQWTSDLRSAVTANGYYLMFSSTVLFSAIILAVFAVYVFDGPKLAKRLVLRLIFGEVFYVGVILFLSFINQLPTFITLDIHWFENHFFSLVAILVDMYVLAFVWSFMGRFKSNNWLILKVLVILLIVGYVDSIVFVMGAFWGEAIQMDVLRSSLIVRTFLSLAIWPLATAYLWYEIKKFGATIEERSGWMLPDTSTELRAKFDEDIKRITTLEQAQQKLQAQAQELQKFKLATDNSYDQIVIADLDGKILYANPSVRRITGFSPDEILGMKAGIKELWGGRMPKEFYQQLWKTIKVDKKPFAGEVRNHRKNGEEYTALATISPVLDEVGEAIYFVAIERDISREKEIDRMKTEFISLASHQLKTPVGALKWFVELLSESDQAKLSAEQKDMIAQIGGVARNMQESVDSLLNISRIESGRLIIDPKPTKIVDIAKDLITTLEPQIKAKKIEFKIEAEEIPELNVDAHLVKEIYQNLLTNALKYSFASSQVTLKIYKKDAEIISDVTDQGYGIPSDQQERVFEKFFRAANVAQKEEGTGLGLYIVKQVVEASGGRIWFTSEEGKGSTFSFSLPLSGSKAHEGEVSLS